MNCKILAKLFFCFNSFDLLFAQKGANFIIQKNSGVLIKKSWQNAHKYCEDQNGRLVVLTDQDGVELLNNVLYYGK